MGVRNAGEPVPRRRARTLLRLIAGSVVLLAALRLTAQGDKAGFPDGYDAVQAAPDTHKVLFENAVVRVLEVSVPPAGKTIPMHHHRWPSFFLSWDTGGNSPHVRYRRVDGAVIDQPGKERPMHAGSWSVQWMKPEPMHSIEVLDAAQGPPGSPSDLRIEIKCPL